MTSMDQRQLRALLADLESDRMERTASIHKTDKFAEAVCAFANDLPGHGQPGYLLIGVDDNGSLTGLSVTDELLKNLAALRSDGNIQPLPALTVSRLACDAGDVAVVEVKPSDLPPVRFRGRIYVRIGPRKGIANEQEERILIERRTANARSFDALPCHDAVRQDLVQNLFLLGYRDQVLDPEIIEENHRDTWAQMASLRFFELRHDCPTHAGVILFGSNPLLFLPGAYVQFLRIDGSELGDEIHSEKQLSGDLLSLLRELDALLEVQIRQHLSVASTLREQQMFDYPPVALRELLMNAVLHRDYQSHAPIRFYWFNDRIEIQSPGGLYGAASPENFPAQNDYRNPVLAEAMKALGYVNRYGRGVYRARKALAENGNPEAEFRFDSNHVLVTLVRAS